MTHPLPLPRPGWRTPLTAPSLPTLPTRQAQPGPPRLRARPAWRSPLWPACCLALGALGARAESAQEPALPDAVRVALQARGIPTQAVSMLVLPADGGPARLDHASHLARQAASVMKLFTTGVALRTLGPAFTWQTEAGLGGPLSPQGTLQGPLYLRGHGDPSLVLERVQLMLSRWRGGGLQHIQGDLVLDRSAFELPTHDPAAFDGQGLKPYNAGPDALLMNHQALTLRLAPDVASPGQVRVSLEPALAGVRVDNQLTLKPQGLCGDWRGQVALRLVPDGANAPPASAGAPAAPVGTRPWVLALSGPYATDCGTREWPLLWQGDGPGDHAARLLSASWRQLGGALDGAVREGTWPADLPVWQRWASPPLATVVRDINKFSNNVMARQLFLSLAPGPGPATLAQARQAVGQHVLAATRDASGLSPCQDGALVLDNGSGLSRQERTSAWCLGRWLQALWASPVMPDLLASLPLSGVDGTARKLGSVTGRAHIKTGSLDGVASVAGVVQGESGRRHVVVGIVNHPQADAARPALEAMLAWAMQDQNGEPAAR